MDVISEKSSEGSEEESVEAEEERRSHENWENSETSRVKHWKHWRPDIASWVRETGTGASVSRKKKIMNYVLRFRIVLENLKLLLCVFQEDSPFVSKVNDDTIIIKI